MIEKIQYCIKEILLAQELLKIPNGSFYKRNISRMVAIRIPSFIEFSFAYNKSLPASSAVNKQKVKDELNALQSLYHSFLKRQRDKLGGHFQDVEFYERIELWAKIDFDTTDFFIKSMLEIYDLFSPEEDYKAVSSIAGTLAPDLTEQIRLKNEELDIENNTFMSSDILAWTRHNTAKSRFFSDMNEKASVLKTLEIIMKYNLEMLNICKAHPDLFNFFKELTVTDIVNYYDNLFTRPVRPGAPQEMDGLDKFLTQDKYPEAHKIIEEFKNNFKAGEIIDSLRELRNEVGGHLDKDKPLTDLMANLNSFSDKSLANFYEKLESLFSKICFSNPVFTFFRMGPTVIRGIRGFSVNPDNAFDNSSVPAQEFQEPDYSDTSLYDEYYRKLVNNIDYEDVRYFFYRAFGESKVIRTEREEIKIGSSSRFNMLDIREAHQYFYNKLADKKVSDREKEIIVKLFCNCKSGYPSTLVHILLSTYPVIKDNDHVSGWYIFAFGEITPDKNQNVFKIITEFYDPTDFYKFYHSLLAIYKTDVKVAGINNFNNKIPIVENEYSRFIKDNLAKADDFLKFSICLAFNSEIYLTEQLSIYFPKFQDLYINYFKEVFNESIERLLTGITGQPVEQTTLEHIRITYDNFDFTGTIILIGNLLEENGLAEKAETFYNLVAEGIIKINPQHNYSVAHLGYIYNKIKNNIMAIEVFKHLIKTNPHEYKYYISLLDIYKEENMAGELRETKEFVLNNYKLKAEDKSLIESNY